MSERIGSRQVIPVECVDHLGLPSYDVLPHVLRDVMQQMDERTGGRFDAKTFRLTIEPTDDAMFMEVRAVMDL